MPNFLLLKETTVFICNQTQCFLLLLFLVPYATPIFKIPETPLLINVNQVKSPASGSSALQGKHFISNPASCASMCSLNSLWWMVALEVYLQEA